RQDPEGDIASRPDAPDNRSPEGGQPKDVEDEMLDAAVEQRIGDGGPEPFQALPGERIDVTQRRERHVEEKLASRLVAQQENLDHIKGRQQRDRLHQYGGQIEHRLPWRLVRNAIVVRRPIPLLLHVSSFSSTAPMWPLLIQ